MARNIAERREEFFQKNCMAEEGDRERTNIAINVVQDMQQEPNKSATRTVADFSWLSNNTALTAEQSAAQNRKALRLE